MVVFESDNTVFFDCDDTLVMWNIPVGKEEQCITFDNYGFIERLLPHEKHISQLKRHAARGHRIVVWSAGGWEWAHSVVKALKLESWVDCVMSKPRWFYDDLTAEEFMPESNRIYFNLDGLNTTAFGDIDE
jgi:phosphoserine phosphatase